jgi:opacity protein-like surface antigen
MKSRFYFVLVAIFALCAMGNVEAKNCTSSVHALEIELGAAMVSPTAQLNFDRNKVGYNLHAELRYNFKHRPFDVGLRVDGDTFKRKLELNNENFKFRSFSTMLVFDWNINRTGQFAPFVGVGVGASLVHNEAMGIKDVINQPFKQTVEEATFAIMPRIGVELFHRARIALYYKYNKKENAHFGLAVGLAIGGGCKNRY